MAVCIILPILVVIIVIAAFRSWSWYARKKRFFSKLGQELDERFITVTSTETALDQSRKTESTDFGGREDRKDDYFSPGSKDLMEVSCLNKYTEIPHVVLQKLITRETEKGSDTTSGCESGRASEAGEEGGLERRSSQGSSRQGNIQQTEEEAPFTEENNPASEPEEEVRREDSGNHSGHNYVGYSKVGQVPGVNYVNSGEAVKPSDGYIVMPVAEPASSNTSTGYIQIQHMTEALVSSPAAKLGSGGGLKPSCSTLKDGYVQFPCDQILISAQTLPQPAVLATPASAHTLV